MEPWPSTDSQGATELKFEDDFKPDNRLPDSVEYLANLERKLECLKARRSKKDLVQNLEETCRSYMVRLVSDDSTVTTSERDFEYDSPVQTSTSANILLRHIAPERQALTSGELVELLKADQLAELLVETEDFHSLESSPKPGV